MNKLVVLVKNIRPYRSLHYAGLTIGGMIFGWAFIGGGFNILAAVGLVIAIVLAFQSAVVVNDYFDLEGDRVSNKERPLVKGSLTIGEYRFWGLSCLFISLLLGLAVGWVPFALICLFILLYFIYSTPPFRLKRFFPVNTSIIALDALLAVMIGFSFYSGKAIFADFPLQVAVMLGVGFLCAVNTITLKDIEADKKTGIKTIPVMLGEINGKRVIAGLTLLGYLSFPLILGIKPLLYPTIVFGLIGSVVVLRKRWSEGPYFVNYFAYLLMLVWFFREQIGIG